MLGGLTSPVARPVISGTFVKSAFAGLDDSARDFSESMKLLGALCWWLREKPQPIRKEIIQRYQKDLAAARQLKHIL
jgi:hypothetical protein